MQGLVRHLSAAAREAAGMRAVDAHAVAAGDAALLMPLELLTAVFDARYHVLYAVK